MPTPARRAPKWAGDDGGRDAATRAMVASILDTEPVRGEERRVAADWGGTRRRARRPPSSLLLLQLDLAALRKVACVRGLGSHSLRARAWPLLLGARADPGDLPALATLADAPHRDASVVECDVERSLWAFTDGWEDEKRGEARASLRRVINGAVAAGAADRVHYYQGLHDVASVLLLVAGEVAAFRLLRRLASCQLRDCTRASLDAALETLDVLPAALAAADPQLARHVAASGIPPHYALPWVLTWFARGARTLDDAARLFDLFAASHPLVPVYLAAVAVASHRDAILAVPADDMAEMHGALSKLDILNAPASPGVDALAASALALYRKLPPGPLLARARARGAARASTAALATLVGGSWVVDDEVDDAVWAKAASAGKRRPRGAGLAVFSAAAGAVALLAALAQSGAAGGGRP
jgi:hypothetical protein